MWPPIYSYIILYNGDIGSMDAMILEQPHNLTTSQPHSNLIRLIPLSTK